MEEKKKQENKEMPWKPVTILNNWNKKNREVEIIFLNGITIKGEIKFIDKYEISVLNKKENKKYVIFKSNIAYISKIKE